MNGLVIYLCCIFCCLFFSICSATHESDLEQLKLRWQSIDKTTVNRLKQHATKQEIEFHYNKNNYTKNPCIIQAFINGRKKTITTLIDLENTPKPITLAYADFDAVVFAKKSACIKPPKKLIHPTRIENQDKFPLLELFLALYFK